jgi:hypothetical protein
MSLRTSSAIWWIFCSVSTRLASARAVRSAARRSRHVGFLLLRAVCFDRLNKPMIGVLSIARWAARWQPEGCYPPDRYLCHPTIEDLNFYAS